jgi:hypothetical protein
VGCFRHDQLASSEGRISVGRDSTKPRAVPDVVNTRVTQPDYSSGAEGVDRGRCRHWPLSTISDALLLEARGHTWPRSLGSACIGGWQRLATREDPHALAAVVVKDLRQYGRFPSF